MSRDFVILMPCTNDTVEWELPARGKLKNKVKWKEEKEMIYKFAFYLF